ncbi:hypothetical protein [Seonamhaeicola marinus]|uniref:Lipoprotein n=1 Tax=Seonamhaeicola marinus TaxID=1912246 RepID=A0A5D0IMJ9_9FLAO|nr:hypothetical protein [Seonamhaeicola marinus]TYA84241.1 hypothetical protein FUA24_06220 [Seonamhaeicola marinus]
MKQITCYILLIFMIGCYVPNDEPGSKFSFGFSGRVEKLEDAFFNMELNYTENNLKDLQAFQEYLFKIQKHDTIIDYEVTLNDCQSIHALVKWNANWNCDSSYVVVREFKHNLDTLSIKKAKEIFNTAIIHKIRQTHSSVSSEYTWNIKRIRKDSVIVDVLNQENKLRKRHFFSFDPIGKSIENKKTVSFIGDSAIIYTKMASQRFMYLESKKTFHKNDYE